ncbi:OmpA family protein [Salisaeta longa]|uniref:OmpA family protein n=1 Tax=Salisaeta longa TaxID=503170 RepID=UPI00146F719B|nr:OmpA family protein [Salisaeta longa]
MLVWGGLVWACSGASGAAHAQTVQVDTTTAAPSRTEAPASVQRVRARIRAIRGGPGPAQQQTAASPRPIRVEIQRITRGTLAPADLRALERRLRADFNQQIDALYRVLRQLPTGDLVVTNPSVQVVPPDTAARRPPAPPDTVTRVVPVSPGAVPPPPPAPVPTVRRVERAILETGLFRAAGVNFAFDESTLLPSATPILNAVGTVMQRYDELRIAVGGHTDSIGTAAYNQQLSEARARRVRQYLIDRHGIAPARLTAVGYGEARPVATNANATGRTLNRRVEFKVLNQAAVVEDRNATARQDTITVSRERLQELVRTLVQQELKRRAAAPDTTRPTP